MERRIRGIILTDHPGLMALRRLAEPVINQADAVVVVDNTPARSLQEQIGATVRDSTYIPMRGNQGVAKGFNTGIQWARDHDFNALLLYRRPYIPAIWKLRDLGMLVLKAGLFSSIPRPRLTRFRMIALGLYDGFFGHSGPCRWQQINAEANLPPA